MKTIVILILLAGLAIWFFAIPDEQPTICPRCGAATTLCEHTNH